MIGERILHIMNDMEISIRGLSAMTGIRQRELCDVFAGVMPPKRGMLQKIAYALGTDESTIYGDGITEDFFGNRMSFNRQELGNTYDAIDEYVRAGAAFC